MTYARFKTLLDQKRELERKIDELEIENNKLYDRIDVNDSRLSSLKEILLHWDENTSL